MRFEWLDGETHTGATAEEVVASMRAHPMEVARSNRAYRKLVVERATRLRQAMCALLTAQGLVDPAQDDGTFLRWLHVSGLGRLEEDTNARQEQENGRGG